MTFFAGRTEFCRFCEREAADLEELRVPGYADAYAVCLACRELYAAGGRRLAPLLPEVPPPGVYRWAVPLADDARAALAAFEADGGPPAGEGAPGAPKKPGAAADREARAWAARLGLADGAGEAAEAAEAGPGDWARALAAAVVAGRELGPWPQVRREAERAARTLDDPVDDRLALLLGLYAHAAARARLAAFVRDGLLDDLSAHDHAARPAVGEWVLRLPSAAEAVDARDPEARRLLDEAHLAYRLLSPTRITAETSDLELRTAALELTVDLERGDARAEGGRDEKTREQAERRLKAFGGQAERLGARLPFLGAFLRLEAGDLHGADRALEEAWEGLGPLPEGPAWAEGRPRDPVEPFLCHDRFVRLASRGLWSADATRALRRAGALAPADRRLFVQLAQAYLRRSLPEVAREVLESRLRRPPSAEAVDEAVAAALEDVRALSGELGERLAKAREQAGGDVEVALLYAACLARLADGAEDGGGDLLAEARGVLAGVEEAPADGARRADALHLRGRLGLLAGEPAEAIADLAAADALAREGGDAVSRPLRERLRGDLVTALVGELGRSVASLEADLAEDDGGPDPDAAGTTLAGLAGLLDRHRRPLREELGLEALVLLGCFVVARLDEGSGSWSGPSLLDRVQGRTQLGNAFLMFRHLNHRRPPDAVGANRQLRAPLPLEPVLRFVEALRSRPGDDPVRLLGRGLVEGELRAFVARRGRAPTESEQLLITLMGELLGPQVLAGQADAGGA